MKPIHDLHSTRRATPDAVGVESTPIPTDDGYGGMLGQPGGQTLGGAVGQEVEYAMVLQIDQDGPIALPTSPGPLIDANNLRGGRGRYGGALHQPEQGGGARRQAEPGCQPSAGLPA